MREEFFCDRNFLKTSFFPKVNNVGGVVFYDKLKVDKFLKISRRVLLVPADVGPLLFSVCRHPQASPEVKGPISAGLWNVLVKEEEAWVGSEKGPKWV